MERKGRCRAVSVHIASDELAFLRLVCWTPSSRTRICDEERSVWSESGVAVEDSDVLMVRTAYASLMILLEAFEVFFAEKTNVILVPGLLLTNNRAAEHLEN